MKRNLIKIMAVVCFFALCVPAYAASRETTGREWAQSLRDKVYSEDVTVLENAKPRLAKEAGEMLLECRKDLVDSAVSDEALLHLTLSEPIPMFTDLENAYVTNANGVRKQPWFLCFCYADGKTVGFIFVEGRSTVTWGGESDAKRYEQVIAQLGGDIAGFFSHKGIYYFINMDGKLAVTADELYPLITFDQYEAAIQADMEYYAQHPELRGPTMGGGDMVFEFLFSNPDTNTSGANKAVMYVALPLLVVFFTAMTILYAKSSKKPRAARK